MNPTDLYGTHKAEAEQLVRSSSGLGGATARRRATVELSFDIKPEFLFFESAAAHLNGRIQTVDVRDVAAAFTAATTADCVGEILLIGGDDATHRLTQGEIGPAMSAAMGMAAVPDRAPGQPRQRHRLGSPPTGGHHPGPGSAEFPTHFVAGHPEETAEKAGWKRYPFRLAAPLVGISCASSRRIASHPGQ